MFHSQGNRGFSKRLIEQGVVQERQRNVYLARFDRSPVKLMLPYTDTDVTDATFRLPIDQHLQTLP